MATVADARGFWRCPRTLTGVHARTYAPSLNPRCSFGEPVLGQRESAGPCICLPLTRPRLGRTFPEFFGVERNQLPCYLTSMLTLTLQHPSDETSELLHACDREGSVRIVAEGRHYLLRAALAARGAMGAVPDFESRLRTVFSQPLSVAQTAAADRMLAGE